MSWLVEGFASPSRVELPTGHHLRPIRAQDVDIDYPAVMGSRDRLWRKYGDTWRWPPESMTHEQDRQDLARHEAEMAAGEAFNYAILDRLETELLGCIYIDPPGVESPSGSEAVVSWWLVDRMVGSELDASLPTFVPRWLADTWGMQAVHYFP
jgi:hypothetical protein